VAGLQFICNEVRGCGYKLNPNVAFVLAPDGSGRLFDLENLFYALSPVAARMVQEAIKQDRTTAISLLAKSYGTEKTVIAKDYDALLRDLQERGLISPSSGPFGSNLPPPRILCVILVPLLRIIQRLPLKARARMLMGVAHVMLQFWGWNTTIYAWLEAHRALDARREYGTSTICLATRAVAARHVLPISCKERALSAWSLCAMEGIKASITLGISLFPLASHCWCWTEEECLSDFSDRCEGFTAIRVYS